MVKNMNVGLHKRRQRVLQLLALGSNLHATISAVSQEFKCSQNAVYRDYQNMDKWGKSFRQYKQLEFLLHARLELLNRTVTDTMLSAESAPDKVSAGNLLLKIVQVQKRLDSLDGQKGGLKGASGGLSVKMPFECDPLIKQAYLNEEKKQRAKAEVDGAAKAESDVGR